jgi:hypothetical protein
VPQLVNKDTGASIGTITAEQLQQLIDHLVEESEEDRDYYIDAATLDYLEENDVDRGLVRLLRSHVPAEGEGIEIEWLED